MTSTLLPVEFEPPQLTVSNPHGLYAATSFSDTTDPNAALRWLPSGIVIRPTNYSLVSNFGIWEADWNTAFAELTEDDVKTGERADISELEPWPAMTVYGVDANNTGDLTTIERSEVKERATRALEVNEQPAVEREFITRLIADASPTDVGTLIEAVGALEEAIGTTSTTAVIHARLGLLAAAAANNLIVRDGKVLRTPAGSRWIFGSGYAAAELGDTLIATGPTFGWRGPVAVRDALHPHGASRYVAIAERSVIVATETTIAAVTIEAD